MVFPPAAFIRLENSPLPQLKQLKSELSGPVLPPSGRLPGFPQCHHHIADLVLNGELRLGDKVLASQV